MTIGDYFSYLKWQGNNVALKKHYTKLKLKRNFIWSTLKVKWKSWTWQKPFMCLILVWKLNLQLPLITSWRTSCSPKSFLEGKCVQHTGPRTARPDMGPNPDVIPPGAFMHFHQDGKPKMLWSRSATYFTLIVHVLGVGTVNSGRICLATMRLYCFVVCLGGMTGIQCSMLLVVMSSKLLTTMMQR